MIATITALCEYEWMVVGAGVRATYINILSTYSISKDQIGPNVRDFF